MRRTDSGAFWEFGDGAQVILPPHDDVDDIMGLIDSEAPEHWRVEWFARWTDPDGDVHVPLLVIPPRYLWGLERDLGASEP